VLCRVDGVGTWILLLYVILGVVFGVSPFSRKNRNIISTVLHFFEIPGHELG